MTSSSPTARIGFIGLGLMGTPMSRRLLEAGHQVWVWNRDPTKTAPLSDAGATVAASIAELVGAVDIIMLCVTDTNAVQGLVFGTNGIAAHAQPHQLLVDFSSIAPDATRQMAQQLLQQAGTRWIDAPVSGGVAGAEAGTLAIMAGGEEATLDQLRPILAPLCQRLTRMGPVGSGQATKICNQMIVSCNLMVMAEVLALAEKAGVDATQIPTALKGGFADSIPLQLTGTRMAERDFEEIKWHVKTLLKDMTMAEQLATDLKTETPMTHLGKQLMQNHSDAGFAEQDPATLIELYSDC